MLLTLCRTAAALMLALGVATVQADELQDITRMMRSGQLPQALDRVDKLISGKPRDAQGRFLKGLILTEMGRTTDAIQVFAKLSEDYPELPEPYNNLAVLYASQGQYEKAKTALENSIRTHPSYATAHENLGDIYAKLASQAYDKALQLDSANPSAKTKLAMIGELIGAGNAGTARAPARPEPFKTTEAPASPSAARTAPAKAVPEAKVAQPAAKAPSVANTSETADIIVKSVRAWAAAWAKKDVDGYLAFYAKDFKTPKGEARADWEKGRRQRISAPKKIEVSIDSPKVSMTGENSANVSFRQSYRSDVIKTSGNKILVMVKSDGKWLIREERLN